LAHRELRDGTAYVSCFISPALLIFVSGSGNVW